MRRTLLRDSPYCSMTIRASFMGATIGKAALDYPECQLRETKLFHNDFGPFCSVESVIGSFEKHVQVRHRHGGFCYADADRRFEMHSVHSQSSTVGSVGLGIPSTSKSVHLAALRAPLVLPPRMEFRHPKPRSWIVARRPSFPISIVTSVIDRLNRRRPALPDFK